MGKERCFSGVSDEEFNKLYDFTTKRVDSNHSINKESVNSLMFLIKGLS
ncbi:MAG: hypothetical protein LBP19_00120 [Treponema sp.]|jgi:hypothetical protein|nr:hypothetical protein [Treponema sp.]